MAPMFAPRNTNKMMTCDPNMQRFWHADQRWVRADVEDFAARCTEQMMKMLLQDTQSGC